MEQRRDSGKRKLARDSLMLPPTRNRDHGNGQYNLGVTERPVTYYSNGMAVQSSSRRRSIVQVLETTPRDDYVSRWLAQTVQAEERSQEIALEQGQSLGELEPRCLAATIRGCNPLFAFCC